MIADLAMAQQEVQSAGNLVRVDREAGLRALNEIFRSGKLPSPPPDGRYQGGLAALDLAPGMTAVFRALTDAWLPWRGKAFTTRTGRGNNIFTRDSLPVGRILWPLYHDFIDDGPDLIRAFEFKTYKGEGIADPGLRVLKIDYNHPGNPAATIRRILDELVQLADGFYFGKAHLKWWWGRWQTVAYFTLCKGGS